MAREAGVNESTIRKIIKDDHKAKSRARTRRLLITDSINASRLQRSKWLLNILKDRKKKSHFLMRFFSTLILAYFSNCSSYGVWPYCLKWNKNALKKLQLLLKITAVITAVITTVKKLQLLITAVILQYICLDVLRKKILPWVTSNFSPDTKIVFQQDGASDHTAKTV